jgi:hypothetical protein
LYQRRAFCRWSKSGKLVPVKLTLLVQEFSLALGLERR